MRDRVPVSSVCLQHVDAQVPRKDTRKQIVYRRVLEVRVLSSARVVHMRGPSHIVVTGLDLVPFCADLVPVDVDSAERNCLSKVPHDVLSRACSVADPPREPRDIDRGYESSPVELARCVQAGVIRVVHHRGAAVDTCRRRRRAGKRRWRG
jgi:hypothetical protein